MNTLILIISKAIQWFLKKRDKGSAYPGFLALKLNKNILKYFELPEKTIFITGTTGKTSVAGMLNEIYKYAGFSVGHNNKGSNLINGVASTLIENSTITGKIKTDVLIIEIDERYVKEVFKFITPKYFIVTNLSRDQLARNGHFELVFKEIDSNIKQETTLILNGDDPLVTKFSLNKKNEIIFYGLEKSKFSTKQSKNVVLDISYCPVCHSKLNFEYFHYGNLGNYSCPKGDYKRPDLNYQAKLINKEKIQIDGHDLIMPNDALYNAYNILSCYTLCKIDGLSDQVIMEAINGLTLEIKRFTTFKLDHIEGTILLSKNETPLSYGQSLEYIKGKKEDKTVAIGFTRISGRYDLKDISWLYDINFELLNDKSVKQIILIGPFAYDLAVRLKLAGIDDKLITICLNPNDTIECLLKYSTNKLYCVFYFDMDKLIKGQLIKRGINL